MPNAQPVPLIALWPPLSLMLADILVMLPLAIFGFWPLVFALFLGLVILVFDIRGRRADFRNAHRHLALGRDPARVAKSYQFSWCGRVACTSAAWEAGDEKGRLVSGYYAANGYRWFHIFPDKTFSRECPFLTLRFWEITLRGNSRAKEKLEAEFDMLPVEDDANEMEQPVRVSRAA
ncbi:MAG: hypothetical protein R3D32_12000 [Nitratireductor sp.]